MRVDNSHRLQIGIDDYGPHKLHTPKVVFPFKIPKHSFKGRIVRKQMQSFGDGQSVTGPDQDSVRFSEFFRNNLASFLPYGTLTVDCRAFL